MRRVLRMIFVLLCLALILIAVGVGSLVIWDRENTARFTRFYAEHAMLRKMRDAAPLPGEINNPWPHFAQVLLQYVPKGSTRADAVTVLATEGLKCNPPVGNSDLLVCTTSDHPPFARWAVEVSFDSDDRVSGGRVLLLKA